MDEFTNTVDSSLFASRAFDDEAYDNDSATARLSRTTISATDEKTRHFDALLVCTAGAPAAFATAALPLGESVKWNAISFAENDIPIYAVQNVAVVVTSTEVRPECSFNFVEALLSIVNTSLMVVCTCIPEWKAVVDVDNAGEMDEVDLHDVLYWLRSTKMEEGRVQAAVRPRGLLLRAPGILEGFPAALLCAAEWNDAQAVAFIGAEHSVRRTPSSLARFERAVRATMPQLKLNESIDYVTAANSASDKRRDLIYT